MNNSSKKTGSFLSKCAYGLADIYGGGAFVIIGTFFTVFLTKSLAMPVALAGTIPLIGKVWDAVTDSIMGNLCDRTSSKLGPKRLYMLIGSIVAAVTFLLMWVSFPISSMAGKYFFYVLMYILCATGFTMVMVPYNALLPDMVEDYTQRGAYTGVRMVFSTFGAILAGLIPTLIIKDNTKASSYLVVGAIFSVIFLVVVAVSALGTWEKQRPVSKIGFKESFAQSLTVYRCRSFRLFLLMFLCGQGAADFVTGMAVYYVDDVLNAYSGGRFTYLMGVLLIAQFLGSFLFSAIMTKTSKRMPILVGFPVRIIATIALLFFSHEGANFTVILALSFIIGLGMAGSFTSVYAILTDMADVDELITSISRPGTVSAMATFIRKIATGLLSTIIGLLLAIVGYDENLAAAGERQAAATSQGIAVLYIVVPTVLCLLTIGFAILFPMAKKQFEIIKREIARRKGLDDSEATPEEIAVCEKVTGFAYDRLWNPDNAVRLNSK